MASDRTTIKKVMVIDNDLDLMRLLDGSLGTDGYDIFIAVDEADAAKVMEKIKPDLVVVDSDNDDKESLRLLDSVRDRSDVPVIMITSDNKMQTLKNAFAHGADDILCKPVNKNVFLARVQAKLRLWQRFHNNLMLSKE
jgi:DNA-binding response OmpR family regulator